jgi:hypothetical protein
MFFTRDFANCAMVEEVKSLFRGLAQVHHPDHGGEHDVMIQLTAAYHARLQELNGQTSKGTDGKEHTYQYDFDRENVVVETLSALLNLKMPKVEILLIGIWLWIEGETKPHRHALKELGCKWHAKRKLWYWRPPQEKFRPHSNGSLADLAWRYGCKRFAAKQETEERKERLRRPALGAA